MLIGEVQLMTFGTAWLVATLTLALHVADEALHDFLAVYNPSALRIRRFLRGLPFPPTFTFVSWITGLALGITLLAMLTVFAYLGAPRLWLAAYVVAGIHIVNGLGHIIGSLVVRRPLPGVLSAPLLVASGLWLAYAATVLS